MRHPATAPCSAPLNRSAGQPKAFWHKKSASTSYVGKYSKKDLEGDYEIVLICFSFDRVAVEATERPSSTVRLSVPTMLGVLKALPTLSTLEHINAYIHIGRGVTADRDPAQLITSTSLSSRYTEGLPDCAGSYLQR
jgi:hypothetical protein